MIEDDEIMRELRAVREAYARKFNYDLKAIFEDIRKQEVLWLRRKKKSTAKKRPKRTRAISAARKPRRAA